MRTTIYNSKSWELHKAEIEKLLAEKKIINLSYELASKEKTKKQIGFFYGALCGQITDYLCNCGFNINIERVKRGLYKQVSEIVPEMVVDDIFGGDKYILHISDMDRNVLSKFIDGVFYVIDNNPMYSGLKLTPDVRYNFAFHIDPEELKIASTTDLPLRDSNYLDYIRDLPCIICGKQHRSHAHHLKDNRLCGISEKAPDWATMPLCPECHLGIAHGTGFKEAMHWLPIEMIDFLRICYIRYKNHLTL